MKGIGASDSNVISYSHRCLGLSVCKLSVLSFGYLIAFLYSVEQLDHARTDCGSFASLDALT